MTWQLLLGIFIGLTTSIFGNLLTPYVWRLPGAVRGLFQRSYHAQVRQQIKVIENRLKQLERFENQRDVIVYLFQWTLGILLLAVLAATCIFIAITAPDATERVRRYVLLLGEACFVGAIITAVLISIESFDLTEAGLTKRRTKLKSELSKLVAELPPLTTNKRTLEH